MSQTNVSQKINEGAAISGSSGFVHSAEWAVP